MHEIQTVEDINMHHGLDNPEDDTKADTNKNQPFVYWVYEVLDFLLHGGNSFSTPIGFFNQQRLKLFLEAQGILTCINWLPASHNKMLGTKKPQVHLSIIKYAEPILI